MTKPSIESVLEELKKNLGEEVVEDILAEEEPGYSGKSGAVLRNATKDPSDMSLGMKLGGRRVAPGNAPELNPEKQARIEKTGEVGMALTPLGRGIGAGVQAAKNFGANVVKGFTGSSTNVTRSLSGSGRFAAPGAASKAGEVAGKTAANPTAQKAVAAGAAATVAGISAKDAADKPEAKADTNSGARKDMPGFKPQREPTGDDLYRDKGSQSNAPETKSEPSAPVERKPQAPITSTKPVSPPSAPARPATPAPSAPARPATPAPSAPAKPEGNFSTNNNSKYGFAAPGSDEDTAANFFSSDARMRAAQKSVMNESKNFDQFVKKFIKEQK